MKANAKKFASILLILSMMGTALVGCGKENKTQTNETMGTNETSAQTADDKMGGEITVAFMSAPENFDPDHPQSDWVVTAVTNHVYEGLFEFSATDEAVPHLAESYEIIDDGKTYDIKLRKGVKFSDGDEMKAEDVKASMERWFKVNAAGVNIADSLQEIEIVNDYEILVKFDQVYAPFISIIASPVSCQKMIVKKKEIIDKFGEDIIGMQEGMRTAVDEAIKGEHMKTELITNVSHDLKTPLTAIVNYVDLLKKCEISDETAREYIGVLEEKSERLKHLIEDLVEASKATTGNVKLNFVRVNLYELAMQAMGENADALEAAGLDVRLNQPEQEPILFADSQKTWRIIDNLISNVKKYALAGTRVYIEVGEENGAGVFAIKNVSREPLDVPIEQLTQRFVRGDASRSTEGSGLGLSIAQSLCELQSGTLEITMDGDLFKVTVRLPLADR